MSIGTPSSRSFRPAPKFGGGISYGPKGSPGVRPGVPANNPRPPLRSIPGGGGKAAPALGRSSLPKGLRGFPLLAAGALLYGQLADYWYPPGVPKAPLAPNPGLVTGMAVNIGNPPYPAEEYRTNLTPRTTPLGVSPVMVYNHWLRWNNGSPRAYWGQSFLVRPGTGYYPVFQPVGDPVPSPLPVRKPKEWGDPGIAPSVDPFAPPGRRPLPGQDPETDPEPAPEPVPPPRPGAGPVLAIDIYPGGRVVNVSGRGKPPEGTTERKSKSRSAGAVIGFLFGAASAATEFLDFVEAVAIGFGFGAGSANQNINNALDGFENGLPFDWGAFRDALIANGLEDALVGRAMREMRKRLRAAGIRVYTATTPNTVVIF